MPRLHNRWDVGLLLGGCILVPLLVGELMAKKPAYAFALPVAVILCWLAARSIVYPVTLAGLPALAIGFYGRDPLPGKVIFVGLTLWLLLGIGFALLANEWPATSAARRIVETPIFLTVAIWALLLARLDPGSYPESKVELFTAQNIPLLLAGILIATRTTSFRFYLLLTLLSSAADAGSLTAKISSGQASQLYPGRFTISTTYNPIFAGRDAAFGVLVAVAFVVLARSRGTTILGYVALPVLAIALLASGSRGPVVSLLTGLLVLTVLTISDRQRRTRLLRVVAGAVIGVVVAASVVPGDAISRSTSFLFGSTSDLSSNGRSQLWSQAVNIFFSHPFAGVGTGGFATYQPVYEYPHDIILEAAAETGIIGALLIISFLFLALRTAFLNWSASRTSEERISAALITALLVMSTVNALLSDAIESTSTLWFLVGLAYGLRGRLVSEAATAPAPAPASALPALRHRTS